MTSKWAMKSVTLTTAVIVWSTACGQPQAPPGPLQSGHSSREPGPALVESDASASQPLAPAVDVVGRSIGELVGEVAPVTKVRSGKDGCWREEPCGQDLRCRFGPPACGPQGCVAMNAARPCAKQGSAMCVEAQSCLVSEPNPNVGNFYGTTPYGQCVATPCEQPEDCRSLNQSCVSGYCQLRSCKASSDCDGYCIGEGAGLGTCRATPGTCVDQQIPVAQ